LHDKRRTHTGVIYRALDCKSIKKPMQIKKASAEEEKQTLLVKVE
jgi:hypothetical protein